MTTQQDILNNLSRYYATQGKTVAPTVEAISRYNAPAVPAPAPAPAPAVAPTPSVASTPAPIPVPLSTSSDINALKANLDALTASYRSGNNPIYPQMVAAQKAYDEAVKQNANGGQSVSNADALALAKAMGATPDQLNALQNKLAGGANVSSDVASKMDAEFQKIMNNPNITADEKKLFQNAYETSWKNDATNAVKMLSSFNTALEYSDPIFKAKAAIVADALKTSLSGQSTDLAFRENQLQNTLKDLQANTEATKGYLDFTHTQELEKLAKSYEQDLQTTRDNLASVGKTSSSVRSRAEQLLSANNTGLVESSNRQFTYQTGQQDRALASSERNLPLEVAQLRDETNRKRIALLRNAETDLGSLGLSNLGYGGKDVLGGVASEIGQKKIADALDWSKFAMKTNFF